MQPPLPTVPAPARGWVSWYRRVRTRDPLRARNRIHVYTFGRDDPATHLIRLNSMLGPKRGAAGAPTPPSEPWLRDRYSHPLDNDWRVPVPIIPADFKPYHYEPISIVLPDAAPTPAAGGREAAGGAGWGGSARGLAAGTALLALLVLLVRTAEKCLDKKLFQLRRRQSEEWPTPNVLATSHRNQTSEQRDPQSFPPDDVNIDLPPPYSECAAPNTEHNGGPNAGPNIGANKPSNIEEPPPPYSACYVTYSNPKDGIPSVHIYNRRRPDEPGSSQDEIDYRGDNEMVFDNGRIVERAEQSETSDVNDISNTTENTTRDRVILV